MSLWAHKWLSFATVIKGYSTIRQYIVGQVPET